MSPQFETVKSFANVPATADGVETISFLEAADGFMDLFGESITIKPASLPSLNRLSLLPIKIYWAAPSLHLSKRTSEITSHIQGVRARYNAHESMSETLENLVRAEAREGGVRQGTACLVRLTRGLLFTCRALQNAQEDRNAEMRVCFKRAYDDVLRHHHSFIIRSVVSVAIHAVPRRDDFFTRIAEGGSVEKLDLEMAKWLAALDALIIRLSAFFTDGNYGRV